MITKAALAISFTAFVRDVLRVVLTLGQAVVGRIAYDGDDPDQLEGEERERAREIFGDVDAVPRIARSVFAAVCGARSGKSYALGALRLLHLALTVPLTTLAPGELAAAIIVAPDLRLARQTLRFALGAARSVPSIAKRIVSETADGFTIRRPDGALVEIIALPATRGGSALRGRSLVCALLDEAAFFRGEDSQVNDQEIVKAPAPRILPGGQILILSTPWLAQGVLYETHRANFGDPKSALVAHAPTMEMRDDQHTRDFVKREYLRDFDNAETEFGAKFLGAGAETLIDQASVVQAIDESRPLVTLATPAMATAAATDLALVNDASAAAVVGRVGDRFELLEIRELRPTRDAPLKLSIVIADFAEVFKRHGIKRFCTDQHLRETAKEFADEHKLEIFDTPGGNEGNWLMFSLLAKVFSEGRFTMPKLPRLESQLRTVVAKPLPGGGFKIIQARRPGNHGDILSAVAAAVWAASQASPPGSGPSHITPRGDPSRYADMGEGGRGFG